jgi:hypothetical protein
MGAVPKLNQEWDQATAAAQNRHRSAAIQSGNVASKKRKRGKVKS